MSSAISARPNPTAPATAIASAGTNGSAKSGSSDGSGGGGGAGGESVGVVIPRQMRKRKLRKPITVKVTTQSTPSPAFSKVNPTDMVQRLSVRDRTKLAEFPALPGEAGTFFSSLFGSSEPTSPAPPSPLSPLSPHEPQTGSTPSVPVQPITTPAPLAVPAGPKVVPQAFWVSDKNVSNCYDCGGAFTFFNRKQYVMSCHAMLCHDVMCHRLDLIGLRLTESCGVFLLEIQSLSFMRSDIL